MSVLDLTVKFCPSRPLNGHDIVSRGGDQKPRPRTAPLVYASNQIYCLVFSAPIAMIVASLAVRVTKGSSYDHASIGVYGTNRAKKFAVEIPVESGLTEIDVDNVALPAGTYLLAWTCSGRELEVLVDAEQDLENFPQAESRVGIAGSSVDGVLPATLTVPEAVVPGRVQIPVVVFA